MLYAQKWSSVQRALLAKPGCDPVSIKKFCWYWPQYPYLRKISPVLAENLPMMSELPAFALPHPPLYIGCNDVQSKLSAVDHEPGLPRSTADWVPALKRFTLAQGWFWSDRHTFLARPCVQISAFKGVWGWRVIAIFQATRRDKSKFLKRIPPLKSYSNLKCGPTWMGLISAHPVHKVFH